MNVISHYGPSMDPEGLYRFSVGGAKALRRISELTGGKRPILIYRGSSGVAVATALALRYRAIYRKPVGLVYVRKRYEWDDCHGNRVEYSYPEGIDFSDMVPVFVDDFIESGQTFRACEDAWIRLCEEESETLIDIEYVLIGDVNGTVSGFTIGSEPIFAPYDETPIMVARAYW